MPIHQSSEEYLETIFVLLNRQEKVRAIDIAHEMGYSRPSVSVALKNLRMKNMVVTTTEGYIRLTEMGKQVAECVFERHVLLTKWLVFLGVSHETAEKDACLIEHVISRESFEAIKLHTLKLK